MMFSACLLSAAGVLAGVLVAPSALWNSESAAVTGSPLVADIHVSPGLEVVCAEAYTGVVQARTASGRVLWSFQAEVGDILLASPALNQDAGPDRAVLAVGGTSGIVYVLDPSEGQEHWRRETGAIGWGGVLWADLEGDGASSLVAATRDQGIVVFDAEGGEVWRYTSEDHGHPIRVAGPAAAADVNGDGRADIFVVEERGVFCLDDSGRDRWRIETADRFDWGCVVADTNDDGIHEVYALSSSQPALYALDADNGDLLWRVPWPRAPHAAPGMPGLSIAIADLNHDGQGEILVGDAGGRVTALSSGGEMLWRFTGPAAAPAFVTAGGVMGDGGVDVLAALHDTLYCLDGGGEERWRYPLDAAVWHAPVLADLEGNGRTALVLGGARSVRALSAGGRYSPALMHWPAARGNAAQSGGWLRPDTEGLPEETGLFWEAKPLLFEGGFDRGVPALPGEDPPPSQRPRGWDCETPLAGEWALDTETKLGGDASVRVSTRRDPLVLVSEEMPAAHDLHKVSAQVMGRGTDTARAVLRWYGSQGPLREDEFRAGSTADTGWRRHILNEAAPPVGARSMRLALIVEDTSNEAFWWDEAQLSGDFERVPGGGAFVNQLGYDANMPKRFTAYSNFRPQEARFVVSTSGGETVFEETLQQGTPIVAGQGRDWGHYYWRGDFSGFREPGTYRIRVYFDAVQENSPTFEIQPNLLWNVSLPVVLSFLNAQRCGVAVPGFHEACHLEDKDGTRSLLGGWHDGGYYDKQDAPYCLRDLVFSYSIARRQFEDSGALAKTLLDEMRWGAAYAVRTIREDGSAAPAPVSNPDFWDIPERDTVRWNFASEGDVNDTEHARVSAVYASALARLARYSTPGDPDRSQWLEISARVLEAAAGQGQPGPNAFNAAMDLFLVTNDAKYADWAKAWYPGPSHEANESILDYESEFDLMVSFDLITSLIKEADALLKQAENPFGVCSMASPDGSRYFPEDGQGNTRQLLDAANLVSKAYRFNPVPEYLNFIYDQINWLLGTNPYGISLIEGLGTNGVPSYHHRYGAGHLPRGAVPGAIANGIAAQGPGDDRPFFDLSGAERPNPGTNGVSIRNNVLYIDTLANLARLRLGG